MYCMVLLSGVILVVVDTSLVFCAMCLVCDCCAALWICVSVVLGLALFIWWLTIMFVV